MTAGTCISCGAPLAGRYCSACGELDPRERRLTLDAFVAESFRAVTDLDGSTLRSVATLFRRPGLLVREYLEGRRRPYLSPIQLFFLANLLFFVAVPFTGTSVFSNPLRNHLFQQSHSGLAVQAMRNRNLELDTPDFITFEARFDQAAGVYARALIIILVPLFALLLYVVRSWHREPALAHLVLALNYVSVLMLLVLAVGVVGRALMLIPGVGEVLLRSERPLGLVLLTALAGYLYLALRRAYGDGRTAAAVRAAALAAGTVLLIVLYQAILFFTVFYSL
jgi:hypothetical protein